MLLNLRVKGRRFLGHVMLLNLKVKRGGL